MTYISKFINKVNQALLYVWRTFLAVICQIKKKFHNLWPSQIYWLTSTCTNENNEGYFYLLWSTIQHDYIHFLGKDTKQRSRNQTSKQTMPHAGENVLKVKCHVTQGNQVWDRRPYNKREGPWDSGVLLAEATTHTILDIPFRKHYVVWRYLNFSFVGSELHVVHIRQYLMKI